ncbi:hypothetical protein [Paenibacillus sp. GCM10012303]|uniref:hypothetical protein n=1 Tax=Paenibacillus sp. GCM10012303 TaxID=3317340 RepID=UPI00360A98CD
MVYVIVNLFLVAAFTLSIRRAGVSRPYSKAQNHMNNQVPGAQDGIGITNPVAYWIIGEDRWSIEKFRMALVHSVFLTLLLIAAYPAVHWREAHDSETESN